MNYRLWDQTPASSRELAWRFWGSARVSRAGFGVSPKRTFLALRGWLDRVR
jgi:hypothetical protein